MSLISKILYRVNRVISPWQERFYSVYAKNRLKGKDFSIICNNCFAGHLYETTNRPFNTPTVGLYFFAEDYIKFVENLESYLDEELSFIDHSRFEECREEHNRKKYPIGLLSNNLEIHFLHYSTQDEALTKWNRRKSRINKEKILIVMNDQNRFYDELMPRFDALKYPKIFLSSKNREGDNVRVISYYRGQPHIGDMYKDKLKCIKDFDLVKWIISQKI